MRIPLATDLESRDGTLTKDAKCVNGIVEVGGEGELPKLRKRPGLAIFLDSPASGTAQSLFSWRGLKQIVGDKLWWLSSAPLFMDSTRKGTNITLSNNGLTVTASGAGAVYSKNNFTNGEISYFEVTLGTAAAQRIGMGTYNAGDINTTPGTDAGSRVIAYDIVTGNIYVNSVAVVATGATATTGDVIGMATYLKAGSLKVMKVYKNGSLAGTYDPGAGTWLLHYAVLGAAAGGGAMTINFGQTAFVYSPSDQLYTTIPATDVNKPFYIRSTGDSASAPYFLMHNASVDVAWYASAYPTQVAPTAILTPSVQFAHGIGYLDGYFFLMETTGKIRQSDNEAPYTWGSLNFLYANSEPGEGRYIGKSLSYIVALKEFSIEIFYNAANPTGCVLSPVPNGMSLIGCASGASVAEFSEYLAWVSQDKAGKRGVHLLKGLEHKKVSTAAIDRVLSNSSLSSVSAFGIQAGGHNLYIINLPSSSRTLVYDIDSNTWGEWTTLTYPGVPVSVTSITRSGTTATFTAAAAHGLSDGDATFITGADQADYNGFFQISYVSTTVFTVEVSNSPTTPATGTIYIAPLVSGYFGYSHAADSSGVRLLLNASNNNIYKMSDTTYSDIGYPIDFIGRTIRLDGGTENLKKMPRISIVGTKESSLAMIRWSDDDYATNSDFRYVDMSDDEPMVRRCGSFRRRSLEFKHVGDTALVVDALELETGK